MKQLEVVLSQQEIAHLGLGGKLTIKRNDIEITIRQSYLKDVSEPIRADVSEVVKATQAINQKSNAGRSTSFTLGA